MGLARSSTTDAVTESAKPYRGKRLSWAEFYSLRPDLKPVPVPKNDNLQMEEAA